MNAPFPRWKKVLIAGAAVLVLLGIALRLKGRFEEDREAPRTEPPASIAANPGLRPLEGEELVARARASPEEPAMSRPTLARRLSPFLLHGGLSFFAGLALGAAARVVLKGLLWSAGAALLVLFGLSYLGMIEPVDWARIDEWLTLRLEEAGRTSEGLREHILLNLPSAALAGAGLVTGLKRK